jgi:tetratricopeptide (TPR) repeat protein
MNSVLSKPLITTVRQFYIYSILSLVVAVMTGCATVVKDGDFQIADEKPVAVPQLSEDLLFELLAAEFAGNAGDLGKSVEYYEQASTQTDDSRVAARASYIALYAGQYDDVLTSLARWQQLDPEAEEINRVYAVTYLKQGKSKKAAEYLYKQLEQSDNNDREKALAVKKLLQKESENADARVTLHELNKLLPGNVNLQILEARYAAQMEDYDGSLQLLDQVLASDPSLADVHIIKSRILAAQGKREQSMAIIRKVLAEQPDNKELRLNYARLLVDERQFTQAREQYMVLLNQDADNADTLLSLSLLSIETKQLGESQAYLEKLIALNKNVDIANYYLGRIAQNDEQHKIAIAYYLKVTTGEYVFDAKLRIAGLFAKLGRVDEGLRQLEVLAEKQTAWPNRVRAYLAQGEILRNLARHEEAVEMYSRALQQNSDDPDLLYARALAAEKVDRLDITEADLLRVISSEPDNANALNALGYTLADRTERLQEALKYIKRAAELVPDDPAILDSLGWVSYRLGKLQDAVKWLRMAFENLEDAEIAAHYGEVLWMTSQQQEAERVWAIGMKANNEHPVLLETLKRLKP